MYNAPTAFSLITGITHFAGMVFANIWEAGRWNCHLFYFAEVGWGGSRVVGKIRSELAG